MIYSILFVILAGISYWYWRRKYVPTEVAQNAADFVANGSLDNLQRGYHGREVWSRVWPGLACCVVPAVPLSFGGGVGGGVLAFLAMAALLAGSFARHFTPLLNLARAQNGDTWLSEWYASPASKSWPDASAWVKVRRLHFLTDTDEQLAANTKMKEIVLSAWLWCRLSAGALAVAAVVVAVQFNK